MKPMPVVILSYNRPVHFEIVLKSFGRNCKYNHPNFKEVFPTYIVVQDYPCVKKTLDTHIKNKDLPLVKGIHIFDENQGAGAGYNKGMEMALKEDPDYILFLEDDWVCVESISKHMYSMTKYMDEHLEVGMMRLRSKEERVSTKQRMTGKKIVWEETGFKNIYVSDAHWTFNPSIVRASTIRDLVPTGYGIVAIRDYQKLNMRTAKYDGFCFVHIGFERAVSVDEKGRTVWKR